MADDFGPGKKPAKSLREGLEGPSAKTPTTDYFIKPDQVASADDAATPGPEGQSRLDAPAAPPSSDSWHARLTSRLPGWPFGKREWLASAAIILVSGSIVGLVLHNFGPKPVAKATVPKIRKVTPAIKTVPSVLTGLAVAPEVNQRPVTGVMIENSLASRPQSGLSEAGVVFEAIAEAGITRFLALYQDTAPGDVGPIRSARPYYVDWLMGFDAGYAHVGGSPDALNAIRTKGVKDLDQFANSGSYHRAGHRSAPHNVYTGVETLVQLQAAKGFTTSKYTGLARKAETKPGQPAGARGIDINISGPSYNVHYDYAAETNTYHRSMGGAPHMDANGNRLINPKVVIALAAGYSLAGDGYHSQYQTLGSGTARVFQDGQATDVTWHKPDERSQLTFTDAAGKPFKLNPGQTWITAVSGLDRVTFGP